MHCGPPTSGRVEPANRRYYALDGLRATMMLLGLVLHTAASYGVIEVGAAWPYKDPTTTRVADIMVAFIHSFRMPVFFMLAGFFGALLLDQRGAAKLLRNRAVRIAVPFATGVVLLFPLVSGGFWFANAAKVGSLGAAMASVRAMADDGSLFIPTSTMHLWFLYYLLYFYAAALVLALLVHRTSLQLRGSFGAAFRVVVRNPLLRVLVPSAVSVATLWSTKGVLASADGLRPDIHSLAGYFAFFVFGWLLYFHRDLMSRFARGAWVYLAVGIALFVGAKPLLSIFARSDSFGSAATAMRATLSSLIAWSLLFGWTGLSLRYADHPSRKIRYVVDASYWVYLIHLPMVIWMPGILSGLGVSALLKMSATLFATTLVCFVSYDLLVRSTVIGRVLNGRRYPRGLPRMEGPQASPAWQRV